MIRLLEPEAIGHNRVLLPKDKAVRLLQCEAREGREASEAGARAGTAGPPVLQIAINDSFCSGG